jgi:hypothetical protein
MPVRSQPYMAMADPIPDQCRHDSDGWVVLQQFAQLQGMDGDNPRQVATTNLTRRAYRRFRSAESDPRGRSSEKKGADALRVSAPGVPTSGGSGTLHEALQ